MANRQRKNQQVKINADAKEFASATFKKYKKHNGDYYDSKKELKESYNLYLVDLLPATIEFVVKYGHIKNEEIQFLYLNLGLITITEIAKQTGTSKANISYKNKRFKTKLQNILLEYNAEVKNK